MAQMNVSLGIGNSYGGLGANLGFHASPKVAPHIGVGYLPINDGEDGAILAAGGIRAYIAKAGPGHVYTDFQFGMLGAEIAWDWNDFYDGRQKKTYYYGPSVLLGWELFRSGGNLGSRFAIGGSYNLADTQIERYQGLLFAFDVGVILRF